MGFSDYRAKVDYLLRRTFPGSWAPPPEMRLVGGSRVDREIDRAHRDRHSTMMQCIEAERRRLNALTFDELDALHAKAVVENRDLVLLREQKEEQGRFFHQSHANADFIYWSKVEYWTLDESLALLLGKSPEVVTWKEVQAYVGASEFAQSYKSLRNLALRAQAMNRGQSGVHPNAVLEWADDMDIPVPQGLKDAMAERNGKRLTGFRDPYCLPIEDGAEPEQGQQHTTPSEQPTEATEQDQQGEAISKPSPIDFDQLATRRQLIRAYGTFTGMDMSWFKSLKDTPKLLKARKAGGKGGRNHAEPLFCPFEVMLWLIDGKRRKGLAMQPNTGWRMLKQHFPDVYEVHQVGSPLED